MTKSVGQALEELRQEVTHWKREIEHLRAEGRLSNISSIERRIADAEEILVRWDDLATKLYHP